MRPSAILGSAVATALALSAVDAYTCSQADAQTGYGLFRAAAARSGCAPYANYGADNTVTINWSCSTTSCTPTMMQLALQLPDCETPSDGINRKKRLEDQLYNQCQLCTPNQQDQIVALWKSAAQTSACSKYATGGGTWFSWPCSATSCTATLKDLAYKVPSCIIGTQNERARILNGISTCTGTTVSTRTPSPASPSTGVSTTTPSTTRPPSTTKPPIEDTPAPPRTTTMAPEEKPNSGMSSGASDAETPAPASTTADPTTCTATQINKMMELFVTAATSSNCKNYGTVSTFGIKIYAPCSSLCVVSDVNTLATALPDCYYAYEGINKKKAVKTALDNCKPMSGRRVLLGDATEKYLTLQVDSKDVINAPTTAPSAAPAKSSAPMATISVVASFATTLLALALAA